MSTSNSSGSMEARIAGGLAWYLSEEEARKIFNTPIDLPHQNTPSSSSNVASNRFERSSGSSSVICSSKEGHPSEEEAENVVENSDDLLQQDPTASNPDVPRNRYSLLSTSSSVEHDLGRLYYNLDSHPRVLNVPPPDFPTVYHQTILFPSLPSEAEATLHYERLFPEAPAIPNINIDPQHSHTHWYRHPIVKQARGWMKENIARLPRFFIAAQNA